MSQVLHDRPLAAGTTAPVRRQGAVPCTRKGRR